MTNAARFPPAQSAHSGLPLCAAEKPALPFNFSCLRDRPFPDLSSILLYRGLQAEGSRMTPLVLWRFCAGIRALLGFGRSAKCSPATPVPFHPRGACLEDRVHPGDSLGGLVWGLPPLGIAPLLAQTGLPA